MPTSSPPKRKKTKFFFILLLLTVLGFAAKWYFDRKAEGAFEQPNVVLERFQEQKELMGTMATITVYAESKEQAQAAIAKAFVRGDEINLVASDYLPKSELTLFNSAAADIWHPASKDLLALVAYGLELAELTDGTYDPTLGTLTHLWRETKKAAELPSVATIDQALALSGWELIEVQLQTQQIRKLKEGVRLDLGGLAKGYAADQMLEVLEKYSLRKALIVIGGDVRCGQAPPNKEGWTIGLKDYRGELSEVITVADCAVSTSGDLQQFVEIEGRRYSHVLDPTTGLGMADSLLATVVAQNGLMADPLATAACVNPVYFNKISPSTAIHSRILSVDQQQVSPGFPHITPYSQEEE